MQQQRVIRKTKIYKMKLEAISVYFLAFIAVTGSSEPALRGGQEADNDDLSPLKRTGLVGAVHSLSSMSVEASTDIGTPHRLLFGKNRPTIRPRREPDLSSQLFMYFFLPAFFTHHTST